VLYSDDISVIRLVVEQGYLDSVIEVLDCQSMEIKRIALWGLSNLVVTDA
jgi:hypothetical protein